MGRASDEDLPLVEPVGTGDAAVADEAPMARPRRGGRGRTAKLLAALVVAAVIVWAAAVIVWAAVSGDRSGDGQTRAPTTEPSEVVRPDVVRRDVLADDGWRGARTADDGSSLVIVLRGGPEYDSGDRCSVRYESEVVETEEEVRVDILGVYPSGGGAECRGGSHRRTVVAHLASPLGDRRVVDNEFDREQPVFDHALAEPGWMPSGWVLVEDGRLDAGLPEPYAPHWSHSSMPPQDVGRDDCPKAVAIHLVQFDAGGSVTEGEAVRTYDLRGHEATYYEADWVQRLAWTEAGQDFDVLATPCPGFPLHPPSTLLRFARSLELP